jgi:PEGA domain
MRRKGGAAGLLVVLGCLACEPAKEPAARTVSLRLRGTPAEASVIVDDETLGSLDFVSAHGVALPPGLHHLTVKAPGYFPWDLEIQAKEGSRPMAFEVALTPVPD